MRSYGLGLAKTPERMTFTVIQSEKSGRGVRQERKHSHTHQTKSPQHILKKCRNGVYANRYRILEFSRRTTVSRRKSQIKPSAAAEKVNGQQNKNRTSSVPLCCAPRGPQVSTERCPGTSGEVPWSHWRGALEPLGG